VSRPLRPYRFSRASTDGDEEAEITAVGEAAEVAATETARSSQPSESVDGPQEDPKPEPDAVTMALAKALEGATAAGRWDVVAQLARELEARRTSHIGVVDLRARLRAKGDR
jgi:hypothetical protein